jgi:predicted O-methyltransferase YrrM
MAAGHSLRERLLGAIGARSAPKNEELSVFMDPTEYSQILAALIALGPRRMLEWGAGGSTAAFLRDVRTLRELVSVEHNVKWYERVRSEIDDARLRLMLRPPSNQEPDVTLDVEAHRAWAAEAEQDRVVLSAYIDVPERLGGTFDCVFVDGRARRFCLEAGFSALRPGGLLILHDAQRPEYETTIKGLGQAVFLTPWHQGQVALVHKPP